VLKIRLRRTGARKKPSYRIVVAEATAPRDGRYIEIIGTYDPLTDPATISLNGDRAKHWLGVGAQPTERVVKLMAREGLVPAPVYATPTKQADGAAPVAEAPAATAEAPAATAEAPTADEAPAAAEASAATEAPAEAPAEAPVEATAEAASSDTEAEEAATPAPAKPRARRTRAAAAEAAPEPTAEAAPEPTAE
jgi:small subunit ribosomal protein S16